MRAITGPGGEAELLAEMRCLQARARVCTAGGPLPGPHEPHPVVEVPTRGPPIRVRVRPTVGYIFTHRGLEAEVARVAGGALDGPADPEEGGGAAETGTAAAILCRPAGEGRGGRRVVVLGPRKAKGQQLPDPWGDAAYSFTWYVGEARWAKDLEGAGEPTVRLASWAASILYDPRGDWGLGSRGGMGGLPALGPGPRPGAAEKAAALEAEFGGEEGQALILWPGGRLGVLGPAFSWTKRPGLKPLYEELPEGGQARGAHESCGACGAPAWGEGVEVENGGCAFWVCEACWRVGVGPGRAAGAERRRLGRTGAEACEGRPGAAAALGAAAAAAGTGAIILGWGGGAEEVVCVPQAQQVPEYEDPAVGAAVRRGAAVARVRTAWVEEA